jgi:hypothetical protein
MWQVYGDRLQIFKWLAFSVPIYHSFPTHQGLRDRQMANLFLCSVLILEVPPVKLSLIPIGAILALYGFLSLPGNLGTVVGWSGVLMSVIGLGLTKRFPTFRR